MRKIPKRTISITCCILTAFLCVMQLSISYAAEGCDCKTEIDGILKYEQNLTGTSTVQQLIDEGYTCQAGTGAEWYILSLVRYGNGYSFDAYRRALEKYINSSEETNPVTRQKNALALLATGYSGPLLEKELNETVATMGIMSLVFALHLMNNGVACSTYSSSDIIDKLLSSRKSDGGWAITGEYSDIDVTAMVIQCLSVHNNQKAVRSAIDGALNFLADGLTNDMEFISYGKKNSESTAQVIVALSSLGIDCTKDTRFIKSGKTIIDTLKKYKNADGGYAHTYGEKSGCNSTFQALSAFTALNMTKNREGSFYIFNKNELSQTTAEGTVASAETEPDSAASSTAKESTVTAKKTKENKSHSDKEQADNGFSFIGSLFGKSDAAKDTAKTSEADKIPTTVVATDERTTQTTAIASTKNIQAVTDVTSTKPILTSACADTSTTIEITLPITTEQITQAAVTTAAQAATVQESATQEPTTQVSTAQVSATQESTVGQYTTDFVESTTAVTMSQEESTADYSENDTGLSVSFKHCACVIIIVTAIISAVLLVIKKKGGKPTIALIFAVSALLIFLLFNVNIQSRDEYENAVTVTDGITVTLSIRCDTVAGKRDYIPADGTILPQTHLTLPKNSTVYDALVLAGKLYSIQFENDSQIPGDNSSAYISGINRLYEFDFGGLSGWVYRVNGVNAQRGCGAYEVGDGDCIEFLYSCNLGEDVKINIQ